MSKLAITTTVLLDLGRSGRCVACSSLVQSPQPYLELYAMTGNPGTKIYASLYLASFFINEPVMIYLRQIPRQRSLEGPIVPFRPPSKLAFFTIVLIVGIKILGPASEPLTDSHLAHLGLLFVWTLTAYACHTWHNSVELTPRLQHVASIVFMVLHVAVLGLPSAEEQDPHVFKRFRIGPPDYNQVLV